MRFARYERQVYYYETDQMAIVHHANYIRWFEEARIDAMEKAGIRYGALEARGLLIPVLSVSCEYKKSVRFGERVVILSNLYDFESTRGVRFAVRYKIEGEDGTLRAAGESRHCFVDRQMRVARIKRDYPDVYAAFAAMESALREEA